MLIYPEVYIRESDGSRETYVSISDLLTKLAATWSKVLKPLRSWKVEISPEIFEPYSDGTDEAVSEFLKSAFPTIDISNTQLSALQALCGGEVDILLYDANETHFIPVFWGVSIFISVIEEGTEFSKIQISAEKKARYALDVFKNAGYELFESGIGTEEDPYVITDVGQLQWMNNDLNAWYELGCDIDASITSMWNGGLGFEPIGMLEEEDRFHGQLDGKNFTISNLYINRPSTNLVGLFGGSGENCIISNLGIVNADITGNINVGIMVGNTDQLSNEFHNCYVSGSVSGNTRVGGFVGSPCNSVFEKCYSTANVTGNEYVGGFVGFGSTTVSPAGHITDCYSTGNVTGSTNVGGFVGHGYVGIFTNCYSAGLVSGDSNVGGFVGDDQSGTYTDCFWDTETSEQATSNGGTGKTTAQMKQQATFTNWDFTDIWDIQEGVTYPWLKAFD